MKVYLDNAATTKVSEEVLAEMLPVLKNNFGNPSSTHSYGREARVLIEKSRKKIAELLNVTPSEIYFTSGGTESDNTVLRGCVKHLGIKNVISSKLEHHAVLHTLEDLENAGEINLSFVEFDENGNIILESLEALLKNNKNALVSLMHGNNEIGNINPLKEIGELCQEHGAIFHSDTVQTIGHFNINLQNIDINYIVGSAHKFHGPKGVGFLYARKDSKLPAYISGGGQERNLRGGTENVYGIVGMAKAFELAITNLEEEKAYIEGLKQRMLEGLRENIPGISFNGDSANLGKSLYTVLNVSIPPSEKNGLLLFNLDLAGICVSGGSACASGAQTGSHVLRALETNPNNGVIRFSFSKYNTIEEIDFTIGQLKRILT
ncbi:cysteine desulfurase family protein [Flexithrix dorotheae]|uniref:cysteine desulfurase family protein n=1 Tax=Flexithrix dorotheae TaxID=70993 RepID=UPI00036CAF43|nr:cysteine desulfurase family protein [Flexithrix dorotheae]